MKFCKDCAHYEGCEVGPDSAWWERCNYPVAPQYDLVSGKQTNPYSTRSPKKERYGTGPEMCGADAKYFESKSAVVQADDPRQAQVG